MHLSQYSSPRFKFLMDFSISSGASMCLQPAGKQLDLCSCFCHVLPKNHIHWELIEITAQSWTTLVGAPRIRQDEMWNSFFLENELVSNKFAQFFPVSFASVVSVVAFRPKGRLFKSTRGCSHIVQKPWISPRLFCQCTLNIYLPFLP